MEINQYEEKSRSKKGSVAALILIAVGLLFLGKNLGWIDPHLFGLIFSWPLILIVWGVVALSRRHLAMGGILAGIGLYFLFLRLGWISSAWFHTYWPFAFVLLGLIILLKKKDNRYLGGNKTDKRHFFSRYASVSSADAEEGYVVSDISFSSVKQIVLDPVFRGAKLDISFGGVSLDLRHTVLEEKETAILIDCSFGGVELYVPDHWTIQVEIDTFVGGCHDQRSRAGQIDPEHKLIISGDISFGGIEIKS